MKQRIFFGLGLGILTVSLVFWNLYTVGAMVLLLGVLALLEFYRLTKLPQGYASVGIGIHFALIVLLLVGSAPDFDSTTKGLTPVALRGTDPFRPAGATLEVGRALGARSQSLKTSRFENKLSTCLFFDFGSLPSSKVRFFGPLFLISYLFIPLCLLLPSTLKNLFLAYAFITLPLSCAVILRTADSGIFLFVVIAATAMCDTFAYFIGKKFGKHRLAPKLSPGKTVEGTAAGILAAVMTVMIFMKGRTLLGFLIGISAVLGDLIESYLKRKTGVKDSGTLIPGHGGILDRIDSHLAALFSAYLYSRFFQLL